MPTILHRLARWADEKPEDVAQTFKRDGQWKPITARQFCDRVYHLALFLESQGISSPSDGACIFSTNCPQWVHMDLAALLVRARSAGIYPNSISKEALYVLAHTEAKVLSLQNQDFYKKLVGEEGAGAFPKGLKLIVVLEEGKLELGAAGPRVVTYGEALAEGEKLAKGKGAKTLQQYLDALDPREGAFMIYTSGTTGNPKGALLSHDNFVYTADRVGEYWNLPKSQGSLFSFLPLCHVAEKLQNIAVGITQRYTVNFCTKFDNVAMELPEVQPSLLLCVPRLWEKMMEGVLNKIERGSGTKKSMAKWALGVGERVAAAKFSGKLPALSDWAQLQVADRLVLSKVRHALGLGKAEVLASGAAALPAHVSKWFRSLQLEILEDFGQTESTGVICMTEPGVESAGTVGKPVPGMEAKIAQDGELLTRGRHVFVGYYKDQASTASTIIDGWLHTGDLAETTDRGLIRIRGRKKEVLKTSGGKMVAPLPIEEALKASLSISQVCIVGDNRKYLSALLTLPEDRLKDLASRGVLNESSRVVTEPEVFKEIEKNVASLNKNLASYEQIKRFTILAKEFSIADGEMTPTLKMKRNVIEARYKDLIDQMYGSP